jgi:Flp pilus assembly protein TadD
MRTMIRNATMIAASAMLLSGCQVFMDVPDPGKDGLKTVLFDAANASAEASNYVGAVAYYRTLYNRDPGDSQVVLGYARNLRLIGAQKTAVEVLTRSIPLMADDARLVAELGKAQLADGRPGEALITFRLAARTGADGWQLRSAMGIAYDMVRDFAKAQESYRAALVMAPSQPAVLNNLALSYALSGKIDSAIGLLQQVAAGTRNVGQARQNLALLYAFKGDAGRAEGLARVDLPPKVVAENAALLKQIAANAK